MSLTLGQLFENGRYTHKMRNRPIRHVRVHAELEGRRIFSLAYTNQGTIKVSFIEANGHISLLDQCVYRPKDTLVEVRDA